MFEYQLHIYLIAAIVFVAIDRLFSVFGIDLISQMSSWINKVLNTSLPLDSYAYIVCGIAALILVSKRDNWLPFLGEAVFPHNILEEKFPSDFTEEIHKNVGVPNAKVIYWASKDTGDETTPVFEAYEDFSNAGVALSDASGNVIFKVHKSTGYVVPSGRYIKRHVHYRIAHNKYSMLGRVNTVYY